MKPGISRGQVEAGNRKYGAPAAGLDLRPRAGLISDFAYACPSAQLWMIGVTGTNGKTSCSQWIMRALNDHGMRAALKERAA